MKILYSILFIFVFAFHTYTQSQCSAYIRKTSDRMTGRIYTASSNNIIVSADKATGLIIKFYMLTEDTIVFHIDAIGGGCIDTGSPVYILFRDQSRLELSNHASFNCDDEVRIYFSSQFRNLSSLKELASKKIEAIRVNTMKSSVEEDFSQLNSNQFLNQVKCLRETNTVFNQLEERTASERTEVSQALPDQINPDPKSYKSSQEEARQDTSPSPKIIDYGVISARAINLVKPPYPPAARPVRATGAVEVRVTVDELGNVISASAVSGHPLLKQASEQAARASKFQPMELNGKTVKYIGSVIYIF